MKLQFTNGYRPHFDQISRILQYLLGQDIARIPQKKIVDILGIPKNQVENLISMMIGFGLVQPRVNTISSIGEAIIRSDPYFETLETLWVIHYIVSSNPEWVVWHRMINRVFPTLDKYSAEASYPFFDDLTSLYSEKTIAEKLRKEIASVFFTYASSAMARLGILEQEATGTFVRGNPIEIPSLAFLFCTLYYRDQVAPGSTAMNVEDVWLAENSPGRVFNLPEYQVRHLLDELHSGGLVRLEKFANLDQVRLADSLTQDVVLEKIYGG